MLTGLTATTNNVGANLKMEGALRTHEQFKALEKQLRMAGHVIAPGEFDQDAKSTKYPLTFKTDIGITPKMVAAWRMEAKAQKNQKGANSPSAATKDSEPSKAPAAEATKPTPKVEEKAAAPAGDSAVKKEGAEPKVPADTNAPTADKAKTPIDESKPKEGAAPAPSAPAPGEPAAAPVATPQAAPAVIPSAAPATAEGSAYGPPKTGKGD